LATGGVQVSDSQPVKPTQRRKKRNTSGNTETLSAYQAFFQANFESYKADQYAAGRKVDVNAIVALIGKRWRELDASGRDAWAGSTVLKKKRQSKNGHKSLTAYQLFFRENAAQLSGKAPGYERAPGITQMDIVSEVGARWRAITPAILADYTERAAEATAQMKAEAEADQQEEDAALAAASYETAETMVAASALASSAAAAAASAAAAAASSSSYPVPNFLPHHDPKPASRATKVDGTMGALRAAAAEAAEAWPPPTISSPEASTRRGATSLTPI
jgi:hypothetical protein